MNVIIDENGSQPHKLQIMWGSVKRIFSLFFKHIFSIKR